MSSARVIVFARRPELGVKTRLAAEIGEQAALAFYRACLQGVLDRLAAGPWRLLVAVTPDSALRDPAFRGVEAAPQGDGDLGLRMRRFLEAADASAPVIVVGSDIPDVQAGDIAAAVAALRFHDLVLGPSPDGGYWLIGASRPPPPRLFDGVRWSTPHARADTMGRARGLKVAEVTELEDVDDVASYRRWRAQRGSEDVQGAPSQG